MKHETMELKEDVLRLIDQRKLPGEIEYYTAKDYREVQFAISDMVVRGAPAIGATGAAGVYLAAREFKDESKTDFIKKLKKANKELISARPTAVNLSWAVNKLEKLVEESKDKSNDEIVQVLFEEAKKIAKEDVEINKQMARNGNEVVPEGAVILTHCNTGALATVGYGTALGVIREAHFSGKNIKVYADETRPRLQGARLTAFELVEEEIPSTLIADSVAATLIRDGIIDIILVGADRIASNGDTANKIGTYMLSELAIKHDVPFYVVAPTSTIDFDIDSGDEIEIEERERKEVTHIQGKQIAPEKIDVYNPAFDITPAENITGIVTEKKVLAKPFKDEIAKL
ncbi:MAG: S-methyl-5-thioribose-1-phosphate isomerase [Halanaerobiales bacterium]